MHNSDSSSAELKSSTITEELASSANDEQIVFKPDYVALLSEAIEAYNLNVVKNILQTAKLCNEDIDLACKSIGLMKNYLIGESAVEEPLQPLLELLFTNYTPSQDIKNLAFLRAVKKYDFDALNWLNENDLINPDAVDDSNDNAAIIAAKVCEDRNLPHKFLELATFLYDINVDLHYINDDYCSILNYFLSVTPFDKSVTEIFTQLVESLDCSNLVNAADKYGDNLLLVIIANYADNNCTDNDDELNTIVQCLLENGADPKQENYSGVSALDYNSKFILPDSVVEIFAQHGYKERVSVQDKEINIDKADISKLCNAITKLSNVVENLNSTLALKIDALTNETACITCQLDSMRTQQQQIWQEKKELKQNEAKSWLHRLFRL